MQLPPPAVFHDKAKRTQQGNLLIIIGLAPLGVSKLIKLVAATCPLLNAKSPKKEGPVLLNCFP